MIPNDKFVKPIIVGKGLHNYNTEIFLRDNSGDNIADLNNYFCELTAMYWIWKNYKQEPNDIVGISHYRRYLFAHHLPFLLKDGLMHLFGYPVNRRIMGWQNIKESEINNFIIGKLLSKIILSSFSVILPYPIKIDYPHNAKTVKDSYELEHYKSDLDKLEVILNEKSPESLGSYYKVMSQDYLCICNMFITNRYIFNEYCSWLFPILFELYDQIKLELLNRDSYQQRSIGFIAERLLNVYFEWKVKPSKIFYLKQAFIN